LKGHFSRSEQLRQALHAAPEAHYSLEELAIADALGDLPEDMKERLARGERSVVPKPEESKTDG
jgi:NADH-quinone oxidoreductase subunit C